MKKSIPHFFISGEGKTDLGNKKQGTNGWILNPGPMYYFIDSIIEQELNYSPYNDNSIDQHFTLITKSELKQYSQSVKNNRSFKLPGTKNGRLETLGFKSRNLALKAQGYSFSQTNVIPLFYVDTDSISEKDCNLIRNDISAGFASTGSKGIAMVPMPTSESWILCIVDNYTNGNKYEKTSPSDNSPNSIKKQLANKINSQHTSAASQSEICDFLVDKIPFSTQNLCRELYSFSLFYQNFMDAVS